MRFMKAIVIVAILSETTLVTTDTFSQSTTSSQSTATSGSTRIPVAQLKVGSVVTGGIQSATIIDKSDNGFVFKVASQNGRPPIIVVVNGPNQEFSIEDGYAAINGALEALGYGGPKVGPKCDVTITATQSGSGSIVINVNNCQAGK
ncbi:hypothetical protein [Bradyrhizobium sp. F1.13.3]|uniref:hypothetical protein n=1 Tax=Bradyrhizobium sp. F1.13.3 TaxID=3156351 RepID=UPI00339B0821